MLVLYPAGSDSASNRSGCTVMVSQWEEVVVDRVLPFSWQYWNSLTTIWDCAGRRPRSISKFTAAHIYKSVLCFPGAERNCIYSLPRFYAHLPRPSPSLTLSVSMSASVYLDLALCFSCILPRSPCSLISKCYPCMCRHIFRKACELLCCLRLLKFHL